MRYVNLADQIREAGVTVEEVPGWQARGRHDSQDGQEFPGTVKAILGHWTAVPRTGDRPSYGICVNGRPGLAGPLCQVYMSRAGVAVVIAAGPANHAGRGWWNGATGNDTTIGVEVEAHGPHWTAAQLTSAPRVFAALCRATGLPPAAICGHDEFALPRGRKTDTCPGGNEPFRAAVAALLGEAAATVTAPSGSREGDTLRKGSQGNGVQALQQRLNASGANLAVDGIFGQQTLAAVKSLQTARNLPADGIAGPATRAALGRQRPTGF